MNLQFFVVDAFCFGPFTGNPAAVVPLRSWLPDATMLAIAAQLNLSETAFLVDLPDGRVHIRWFSPLAEIDFCGHATLASAQVLARELGRALPLTFFAAAVGDVNVQETQDGLLAMDFPNRAPVKVDQIPPALQAGLSISPRAIFRSQQAWFALYPDEATVRAVRADSAQLKTLGPLDVVVTAPGDACDFVSRYFWPANGGDEDPVTGSIHAGLAPFWAERLGKTVLHAKQVSSRGGELFCEVKGERVIVAGRSAVFACGHLRLP